MLEVSYAAQLLDGESPHPVNGTVQFCDDELQFVDGQGESQRLRVDDIESVQTIGSVVHVVFRAEQSYQVTPKLIVQDVDFAPHVAHVQTRYASNRGGGLRLAIGRIPLVGWIVAAIIVIPLAYFAVTKGVVAGHVLISIEQEEKLGEVVYDQLMSSFPPCNRPELQASVQTLVDQLVGPDTPYRYRVTIVDSEDANAFALPGGQIVLLSGLFDLFESPEGLAGILAHEIAHVEQRHSIKQLLRSVGVIAFMSMAIGGGVEQLEMLEAIAELSSLLVIFKHSREAESESDEIAVQTLHRHGLSVAGLIGFFEAIEEKYGLGDGASNALAWVTTHPVTKLRVARLRELEPTPVSKDRFAPISEVLDDVAKYWTADCLVKEVEEEQAEHQAEQQDE